MDNMQGGMNVDFTIYKVLDGPLGSHMVVPIDAEVPAGWTESGKTGTKEECERSISEPLQQPDPVTPIKRRRPTGQGEGGDTDNNS
jgi:uncharacterized protein YbdZ (MbtH family)